MNKLTVQRSKNQMLNSLQFLFKEYKEKRAKIEEISDYVSKKGEVLEYFLSGNKVNHQYANVIFQKEGAIAALNSEYWNSVIKMTDVISCMAADKRNELFSQIRENKTPDFEEETVINTIYNLLQNRESFFADKVDGIFQKLSRSHVTNSPMGFKQRMIIDYALTSYGSLNWDRAEYIQDLRSVISKIMKRDVSSEIRIHYFLDGIISSESFGKWHSFDGGAFKLRIYKKGTIHIEIAEEMSTELNSILAQKYPSAIPEKNRAKTKSKTKEFNLEMKLISFEACNKLFDIADTVARGGSFSISYWDSSADDIKNEIMLVLEYFGVIKENKTLFFNYDCSEALREVSRMGCLPDKKSHQFYPTSEYLARRMVRDLNIQTFDKVLEPSAGLGGIAQFLPKKQTTCIEISEVHCAHLKSMDFKNVIQMDFLQYNESHFDKIIMNPPFTKNQAKDHLIHAISLLSEDGVLKAILPASYYGKKFCTKRSHNYSEAITGEFEGTNVSVVILTLSKS